MYALKVLAAVDVNRFRSNQHEFNGAASFRRALGTPRGKIDIRASVLELDYDDLDRPVSRTETWMTWYNARENNPRRAPEFRLYYRPEIDDIVGRANPGDILFLSRIPGADRHCIEISIAFARQDSMPASVLAWAFGRQPSPAESSPVPTSVNLPHGSCAAMDALGLSLGTRFHVETPDGAVVGRDQRIGEHFDQAFREREQRLAQGHYDLGHAGLEAVSVFFDARARARVLAGWGAAELRTLLVDEVELAGLDWKPALDRDEAGVLVEERATHGWIHAECRPLVDSAVLGRFARGGFPRYLITMQPGLGAGVLREIAAGGCRLVVPEQFHCAYPEEWRGGLLGVSEWIAELS